MSGAVIGGPNDMEKHLFLKDVLDLKAAGGLHSKLLGLRGEGVVLDASEVQRLGGQCLQVLLAAIAAWREDGKSFSFANPSDAFMQALNLFGIKLGDFGTPQQDQHA